MSKLLRNAPHGPGHTCLAFSPDGKRAFTGGQDCIVRIWKMEEGEEQEPEVAAEADGAITTVVATSDCWLSGSEDAEVRRYFKNSPEFDVPLTSTNAIPVRCVAVDPKGTRVAVASDNLSVKLLSMEDIESVSQLEGFSRGVRKITWHPSGKLLTTCDSDGKIIVWDAADEQPKIEKIIEGVIPAVIDQEGKEFAYDCSAIWHTSGQYFFAASRSHEIVTISRTDWTKSSTFSDKSATGAITALALSVNGVYLASASHSKVHIWSTQTRRIIATHPEPTKIITQLAFSPTENLLAWTDTDGAYLRWRKPIPDTFPSSIIPSIGTNAASSVQMSKGPALFDELLVGGDSGRAAGRGDDMDLDVDDGMPDDDWIVDDLGDDALRDEPIATRAIGSEFVKEMVSITKAQPPFQPGSTPMDNKKRYLAYNTIGVIEVTDQDTHHIVNVEFFDRSTRKGYHFNDHFKYDLGYLGDRGAVFACPPETDHPAQVLFKPYSTWAGQREWTYPLTRKGSRVLGVAAGGLPLTSSKSVDNGLQGYGHVVIATSENDLTFLSGTGRERRIMGLGGDFVSMVASADWVFVVHRAGSTTIDGSQNLSYSIINFEDFSVRQRDVLPIPKGHTIKWIGVTDQGAPALYDTTGWVHVLTKYRIPHHASWARVMDTNLLERRQGKDESYWPVGINESRLMCLILKGRQEHPGFPRPLVQELDMHMPFRREEPREEQVERELLLVQNALDCLDDELTTDEIVAKERAMDKEFIFLIQAACKADNVPRAIELTKLLHHIPSLDAVGKLADFYHLVGFREKVEILKTDREENEDRLIAARNKRRRWLKPEPALRQVASINGSSSHIDPLGDIRPPPAIERPGMTRVTVPVIETTRYSSVAPSSQAPSLPTWEDTSSVESPMSTLDGKRKRTEVDDPLAPDFIMPPPKQKANPFARKTDTRNPFARKTEPDKTIHKSESFFEKVDAAESDVGKQKRPAKGKEKEKIGPKQATLFGMMPKAPPARKTKPKKTDFIEDENGTVESQDISMADASLVETQGDNQATLPDEWEETQPVEEETQLADDI